MSKLAALRNAPMTFGLVWQCTKTRGNNGIVQNMLFFFIHKICDFFYNTYNFLLMNIIFYNTYNEMMTHDL